MTSAAKSPAVRISERKVERLQEAVQETDLDIEDARYRVQAAERAQWSQISYSRRGDVKRTLAIVAVIQALKKKAEKQLKRLQSRKRDLEADVENERYEGERRADEDREREAKQKALFARVAANRERQEETERARADEKERIERSRKRVAAEERRRGLNRDDEEPGHEPEIGF